MILAEKITRLRKEHGWSQEELAVQLGVSRQSVSKWESTASVPDLDKILKMSELFGVSTDYLLEDSLEEDMMGNPAAADYEDGRQIKKVSVEEANRYMETVAETAKKTAAAVAACILSPALLILLAAFADSGRYRVTEAMAAGIGVVALLMIVAGAVAVFILTGMKLEPFEYLEKELLDQEYGVEGIVRNKKASFEPVFKRCIAAGVALCIISAVPIMTAVAFEASDTFIAGCVDLLLLLVALGVFLFVWSGSVRESYQVLLEEGDFTREKKLENKKNEHLAQVYWGIVTAIYLGYSFITMDWHISWVVWPCAAVLFAAVCGIAAMIRK